MSTYLASIIRYGNRSNTTVCFVGTFTVNYGVVECLNIRLMGWWDGGTVGRWDGGVVERRWGDKGAIGLNHAPPIPRIASVTC